VEEALKKGFLKTDQQILQKSSIEGWTDGSTAVLALVLNDSIYIANTGDSEAVLGRRVKDGQYEAILLSEKHKPSTGSERQRIEKAGGHVIFGNT
jgi:protein phosphatase 2C family protein 2/3